MSRICQITGISAQNGNNVSHSKRRTKRLFEPNLHVRRFYIPEEDRWVTLKVSCAGVRLINKIGVKAALKRASEKGFKK